MLGVEFEIIRSDSIKQENYSGKYVTLSSVKKKIILVINSHYTQETIVSILAHEISHYFLAIRGIKLEDTKENEILTDICAIYLGFGNFMLHGYAEQTIYYDNYASTSKLGYINTNDIYYIMNKLEKISSTIYL